YPKAYPTYNTSNVPLELWTIIARFASRQSLARLCSVSHYLCPAFTSLLYSNTIDPPLTASQSTLLIQTLSSDIRQPHPPLTALICDLGLVDGVADQTFCDKTKILKTLSQLDAAQRVHTLHWSLAAGVEDLGRILGAPGDFRSLKNSSCLAMERTRTSMCVSVASMLPDG
ncbi:hypothetical protein B0H14DRAFT_2871955, partial [Mycena olivaceomarginata]